MVSGDHSLGFDSSSNYLFFLLVFLFIYLFVFLGAGGCIGATADHTFFFLTGSLSTSFLAGMFDGKVEARLGCAFLLDLGEIPATCLLSSWWSII
jgi:hypothetical protein